MWHLRAAWPKTTRDAGRSSYKMLRRTDTQVLEKKWMTSMLCRQWLKIWVERSKVPPPLPHSFLLTKPEVIFITPAIQGWLCIFKWLCQTRTEHTVHSTSACNPSTWEAETGGLRVWGQPGLHSQFQSNLCYLIRPHLKNHSKKITSIFHMQSSPNSWCFSTKYYPSWPTPVSLPPALKKIFFNFLIMKNFNSAEKE
jgi:hypothetical protein